MRLFQSTYKNRHGKTQQARKWVVEFKDHTERVRPRRLTAFADKAASSELGRHFERLVSLRAAGSAPDLELTKAIEAMPSRIKQKLVEWGLLDGHAAATAKPIVSHLSARGKSLVGGVVA